MILDSNNPFLEAGPPKEQNWELRRREFQELREERSLLNSHLLFYKIEVFIQTHQLGRNNLTAMQ